MTDVAAGSEQKVAGAAAGGGAGQAVSGSAVQDTGAGAGTVQTRDTSISSEKKQLADTNTEELMSAISGVGAKMSEHFSNMVAQNTKRTADLHQSFDLMVNHGDLDSEKERRSALKQHTQNAITQANVASLSAISNMHLATLQALKHSDVAMDNLWNPVQQGAADTMTVKAVQLDDASTKAIAAALASAFANALSTAAQGTKAA